MYLEYTELDGKRYFSLFKKPILFGMSLSNKEVTKKIVIPGNKNQVGLYTQLFAYGRKILLIPMHAKEFVIYDLQNEEIRTIAIPNIDISREKFGYFVRAVQWDKYVYAIGVNYPGIIKIDMEKESSSRIIDYETSGIYGLRFGVDLTQIEDEIILPIENSTKIGRFRIIEEQLSIIETHATNEISTICSDSEKIWAICVNGEAFLYDRFNNIMTREDTISDYLSKTNIFSGTCYKDQLFLFPLQGNRYFIFDICKSKGDWREVPISSKRNSFYYIDSNEKELSFFCEDTGLRYTYSDEKECFEISDNQLSKPDYCAAITEVDDNIVIFEDDSYTLRDYLHIIV